MINPESRTREWIESLRTQYPYIKDASLLEKTIRAFSLLEALARSGCPFIFKGGSSLMLYFGSSKRLSIDVDIICPPGTDIEKYWSMYAGDYGFTLVEAVDRIYRSDVPKTHAKCHYQVSYKTSSDIDTILLDLLTEDNNYHAVESRPFRPFPTKPSTPRGRGHWQEMAKMASLNQEKRYFNMTYQQIKDWMENYEIWD